MSGRNKNLPLLFLLSSLLSGQVVFSRRVYKEAGPSYQQIELWNPADGSMKQLTHSARNHFRPTCGNGRITFTSQDKLWSLDRATGEERPLGPVPTPHEPEATPNARCDIAAKFGTLEACGKDEQLTLFRNGNPARNFHIQINECNGPCQTPIWALAFSGDGKRLLVGEEGIDYAAGDPQMDYYLLDVATMKLAKAISARNMFWLPGREELIHNTPRDLAPLPGAPHPRQVWVQQMMLFDPATAKSTVLTSGLTNNIDAAPCSQ